MRTLYFFGLVHSYEEMNRVINFDRFSTVFDNRRVFRGLIELITGGKRKELLREEKILYETFLFKYKYLFEKIRDFVQNEDFDVLYLEGIPNCWDFPQVLEDYCEIDGYFSKLAKIAKERNKKIIGSESLFLLDLIGHRIIFSRSHLNYLAIKRDRYIASKIRHTLRDNETGVLVMGMAHDPIHFIKDNDIRIIKPNICNDEEWEWFMFCYCHLEFEIFLLLQSFLVNKNPANNKVPMGMLEILEDSELWSFVKEKILK